MLFLFEKTTALSFFVGVAERIVWRFRLMSLAVMAQFEERYMAWRIDQIMCQTFCLAKT